MRDFIGHTLGRYRIVEKIGEGGMGEVYRAHDERLDRDVAVKVLPSSVARDPERISRFEREAKAVARLDHPNILAIHDFDNEDGLTYAVTELLEGESLRGLISKGGISSGKAVEYAGAIADGLAAAHDKGIVHRDLKPENVFLTNDGRIKILDFGLAKLKLPEADLTTETPTATLDTTPGGLIGTVPYMAPEQVQGQPADHRSDIFALGVVLYEMLTGQRPFRGTTTMETAAAILKEDPEPVSTAAPGVPPTLAGVVAKCLEKRPEDRFSSAHDLSITLGAFDSGAVSPEMPKESVLKRRWPHILAVGIAAVIGLLFVLPPQALLDRVTGTTETPPIRSIALLPLVNLTGDPDQAYFVDGLHEELIATFAQVSGFDKVIARSSVTGFSDSDTPVEEIGRQLGVEAVIVGSVRRSGNTVRATLQLIDARTEEHLWAKNFDRELEDILALHSEVARAVADAVNVTLSNREEARFARSDSVNHQAYEAYLMGNYLRGKGFVEPDLMKAIGFYQLAIEKDPNFARAYVGLATGYTYLEMRFRPAAEVMPKAKEAAQRAVELDDSDGEAHAVFGMIKSWWEWEWEEAEAAYRMALELQPNNARVNALYTQHLTAMLRFDEAVATQRRAVELSPLSRMMQESLGWVYWATRRYDEAATYLSDFIARYPDAIYGRMILSWTYSMMGRTANGVAVAEEARDRHPAPDDDPFLLMTLAWAYGRSGDTRDAEAVLSRLHELRRTTYIPPSYLAFAHYGVGDPDSGYEWFRTAVEERQSHAKFMRVFAGMIADMDADPRIHDLIQGMDFPEN